MSPQSEALTCENCGQSVLPSDIECWHCGASLSGQTVTPPADAGDQIHEEARAGCISTQLLFYAVMTAVIALSLLLVIRSLGQQPRLAASLGTDDEPAVQLIAPDGSFSIDVPAGLVWYFPRADHGQSRAAAQMVNDPQFEAALQPLFGLASDAEVLLTAQVESGILAVARSERLGGLTVNNVADSLAKEDFPGSEVISTRKGISSGGTALAEISIQQEDPSLMCRQHFLRDSGGAYLIAVCTEPANFQDQSADFDAILSTFKVR